MSEARTLPRMTPDEFFVWQAGQDRNYELVDGVPVLTPKAITGASRRHDRITVNILSALDRRLDGTPCAPNTDDIAFRSSNGNVRRPDILVDCRPHADSAMVVEDPTVLVEVLSPSTTRFDRFKKVEEYKQHPCVRVVLLVALEAAEVIVWRLTPAGWSSASVEGVDAVIPLPEIGTELPLAEIYRRTDLVVAKSS